MHYVKAPFFAYVKIVKSDKRENLLIRFIAKKLRLIKIAKTWHIVIYLLFDSASRDFIKKDAFTLVKIGHNLSIASSIIVINIYFKLALNRLVIYFLENYEVYNITLFLLSLFFFHIHLDSEQKRNPQS